MVIRTAFLALILITAHTLAHGQGPVAKSPDSSVTKVRDLSMSGGVDLRFLIRELGRDLDLNVLFDPESRLENRRTQIELRNVTTAAALDALLLQEGLYFEPAGPKAVLVANRVRGVTVASLGINTQPIGGQLGEYFGVTSGVLIVSVPANSPASLAGLKAGDVIVGIDGTQVGGTLGLIRAIDSKTNDQVSLEVVRDHESRTVKVTPRKGIQSVLDK